MASQPSWFLAMKGLLENLAERYLKGLKREDRRHNGSVRKPSLQAETVEGPMKTPSQFTNSPTKQSKRWREDMRKAGQSALGTLCQISNRSSVGMSITPARASVIKVYITYLLEE